MVCNLSGSLKTAEPNAPFYCIVWQGLRIDVWVGGGGVEVFLIGAADRVGGASVIIMSVTRRGWAAS